MHQINKYFNQIWLFEKKKLAWIFFCNLRKNLIQEFLKLKDVSFSEKKTLFELQWLVKARTKVRFNWVRVWVQSDTFSVYVWDVTWVTRRWEVVSSSCGSARCVPVRCEREPCPDWLVSGGRATSWRRWLLQPGHRQYLYKRTGTFEND